MKKIGIITLSLLVLLILSTKAIAQRTTDIEGGKDYPTISRFEASIIEFYKETKWGSYKLPLSELGVIDWGNPKVLEGKVTRIQYSVSKDNNSEFVLRNYKAAFNTSGYKILIAIANEELGVSDRPHQWTEMYYVAGGYYNGIGNSKFGLGFQWPNWNNNQCFIVAKGHEKDKDFYAIVYAIVDANYTLITQDVIEVEAVETGSVTAENLSKGIIADGHIAVYGIHFEIGNSEIKDESEASLKLIADYLKSVEDKKFFIVGHTDNTGLVAENMKLSESRAKSVMDKLINNYGVNSTQILSYGVSSLAPIASNLTDEGKAKNRRVEIVEQ